MCKGRVTGAGAVYGLGLIGVLVFYWQHAVTAADVLLGFLKAVVWPALLTYKVFGLLKI